MTMKVVLRVAQLRKFLIEFSTYLRYETRRWEMRGKSSAACYPRLALRQVSATGRWASLH